MVVKIKKHKTYTLPKYVLCTVCKKVMVKKVTDTHNYIPLCKNCKRKTVQN